MTSLFLVCCEKPVSVFIPNTQANTNADWLLARPRCASKNQKCWGATMLSSTKNPRKRSSHG